VIVLGSLSKTYAMTGWRAGFALGPKPIIAAMGKLQSQSTSSTAAFVQKAAIAALTGSQACVAEMRADYLRLRDRILKGFETIPGITCTKPDGAFYVYPNVSSFLGRPGARTTTELASRLLQEAHVVTVPGEAFGTQEHIRLSYAVAHNDIEEGLVRMKSFFSSLA
jgi:aspartate aminotransferase